MNKSGVPGFGVNSLKKESFFLNVLSEKGVLRGGYIQYRIRPQYGDGSILLYPLFPGLYLSVNDFRLHNSQLENRHHSTSSKPFLKFDYCIRGGYRFSSPGDRVGIIGEEECGCYAGYDTFDTVEFVDGKCCSVSLFCYLDEYKSTLKQQWGDPGMKLDKYYNKICERDDFLITKNDPQCGQLLKEIQKIAALEDPVFLRLRTTELFFREVELFLNNKKKEKKFYSRIQLNKVARVKEFIDENYHLNFTVEDLSMREMINSSYLKTIFKERYGDSIHSYKKTLRLKKAQILLKETNMCIYEIVEEVGYSDVGKFTKAFKEFYNYPPGEYRKLLRY